MVRAQEVIDYVFEIAPNPPGMTENVYQYGTGDAQVRGIALAWWITPDILAQMIARGQNLGLSHETVRFPVPDRFVWGPVFTREEEVPANQRIAELIAASGIVIHRFHSNLDKAPWGMPGALLRRMGWERYPVDWSRGVPVVELPPRGLADLVREVKEELDLPFVRWDGEPERCVTRVAIPWGGLCQGWGGPMCPAPLGFDVLIGGDIIDGVVRLARAEGWAVIDAMHHATEMDGMRALADRLAARFPDVAVEFYPNSAPWRVS